MNTASSLRPQFHEAWFGVESIRALSDLVQSVAGIDGDIVEIGSWEGCSTCAMAIAAHPRVVHAVDTWQGSPGEISAELAAERDVFAQFECNVAAWAPGNVVPHRMSWREYRATHHGPVALVFIDAEHTYREVYDTITAFLPLVVSGGVICGDDQHHPPIRQAVSELIPGALVDASVWFWRQP